MNYFAFWYVLGAFAIWFIGFETRGRTIDEINSALTAPPSGRRASVASISIPNGSGWRKPSSTLRIVIGGYRIAT